MQSYNPPTFNSPHRLAAIQDAFPQLEALYKKHADENHLPGYAFGIVMDGSLIYTGNGGFQDLEKKTPVTSKTMFRIASMTKSLTAMAIIKLRDEGKLRLDDPIELYILEMRGQKLTQDAPSITIRDLLIHNAGLPQDDPWADRKLADTQKDLLELLGQGISFSNSARMGYEYSNLGYTLLGSVITAVTQEPYENYIISNITQPLKMQCEWDFSKVPEHELALGYRWTQTEWKQQEMEKPGVFGAMGGLITSIESFSRYAILHMDAWPPRNDEEKGPLRRSSLREMHLPASFVQLIQKPDQTLVQGYGYGLRWICDTEGKIYVVHSGGLPGFGSNWTMMPAYNLAAIAFANATYAPMEKANLQALELLRVYGQLLPRELPPSEILLKRQKELLLLLPDWEEAEKSDIFADNFFLDYSIEALKTEARELFAKANPITQVGDIIPANQLRGQFLLKGLHLDLQVTFTLTPEPIPKIQSYQIKATPAMNGTQDPRDLND